MNRVSSRSIVSDVGNPCFHIPEETFQSGTKQSRTQDIFHLHA